MYYLLVSVATVLFGLQFFFQQRYEKTEGAGVPATMIFSHLTTAICAGIMFCLNGFRLSFSLPAMGVAALSGLNNVLYIYSAGKAMERVDLTTFSLFAMLGGMTLPFLGGILFWGEALSAVKIGCFLLIAFALWLGTGNRERRSGGFGYYAAVFVFNGMSGVFSKLHQTCAEPVSGEGYMLLTAMSATVISGVLLLLFRLRRQQVALKSPARALPVTAAYALFNGIGNLILVLALVHIDASVQYPFVTGGTIIVSALIDLLAGHRPTRRKWLAVAVAFAGALILVF